MAIDGMKQAEIVSGLVNDIFERNGLIDMVDPQYGGSFSIDWNGVSTESPESFKKDVAGQMMKYVQGHGRILMDQRDRVGAKWDKEHENKLSDVSSAIKSAGKIYGVKNGDIFSIFGRDKKQPFGAVNEGEYQDASLLHDISVDELKRLVGEYRKAMQMDVGEASRMDAASDIEYKRKKMARDFDLGKYDDGNIDAFLRNLMKYGYDGAYRRYTEQIAEGKGSDEILEDFRRTFVNGDGRLGSALIDAGKDIAQIYGPKGAGSVITKIPKAGPAIGKAAAGVGEKLAITPIGNSVGSKAAYAVNPLYDMGVDAGAQLADRGEVDADRVAAVGQSSLTYPILAGMVAQAVTNVPGRLRSEALAFQRSAKRGSSNSFDTRLDMRDDYARLQKLKKASEAEGAYPALKETAKADYAQALNEFKAKYPHENVEQLIAEGADKSKVGVAPAESYLQRNEALSPSERLIVNYQEPNGNGLGSFAGSLVSPVSQQITRAKYDSGKLEEMYAEEEKKRKEAMKKAQEVYRKYGYSPYPQLLSDEQPEQ